MKSKLKNHFTVKSTLDLKTLEAWLENQVGERKAKIYTDKGFKGFVVEFKSLEAWKSRKQLNCIYGLLKLFYKSGCYSNIADNYEELKKYYKRQVDLIDCYVFYDGKKIVEVKEASEIPNHISLKACRIILGSFSKISKKKATDLIGLLKTDMIKSKIMQTSFSKEFEMILDIMAR